LIDDLRSHYRALFDKYDDAPEAVQQKSAAEQARRFILLTRDIPGDASIVDVGCGLGDMLPFLRAHGYTGAYLGLDLLPEFIATARVKHNALASAEFREFDFDRDVIPSGYDYALVSGAFNNKLPGDANLKSILRVVGMLVENVRQGVAFNALSTHVEFKDEELFYISPEFLFDHIRENVSKYVTLKHDYVLREGGYPYEFTMYVRKHAAAIGGVAE
jgi:SAM-dependent methyltransferase